MDSSIILGFGGSFGSFPCSGGLSTETTDDARTSTLTMNFTDSETVRLQRTATDGFLITLNVTVVEFDVIGNGSDWMLWSNSSNPDTASPWSWDFDFPNGTGYYEFYSVGKKSGSNDELAPVSADAICFYNASTDASINVTPSTWDIGSTTIGAYNYSTTGDYFNLTNDGNVALDIQIMASNATNSTTGASWNLTDTPGFDNYSMQYNRSADVSWTNINQSYDTFVTSLAVGSWQTFDLNVFMATTSSKSDPLEITVTFRAVAS